MTFRKGHVPWNKGIFRTEEDKQRQREIQEYLGREFIRIDGNI